MHGIAHVQQVGHGSCAVMLAHRWCHSPKDMALECALASLHRSSWRSRPLTGQGSSQVLAYLLPPPQNGVPCEQAGLPTMSQACQETAAHAATC